MPATDNERVQHINDTFLDLSIKFNNHVAIYGIDWCHQYYSPICYNNSYLTIKLVFPNINLSYDILQGKPISKRNKKAKKYRDDNTPAVNYPAIRKMKGMGYKH